MGQIKKRVFYGSRYLCTAETKVGDIIMYDSYPFKLPDSICRLWVSPDNIYLFS
jgi:hypothetical protein